MHDAQSRVYEMLDRALEKMSDEQLTSSSLDSIFKIVGTMYKLDKMGGGEGEYSLDGYSNARGRGRNARRDSMGRYAREGGMSNASYEGGSYDGSYDGNSNNSYRGSYGGSYGYSRHNKDEIKMEIENLMQDAKDPQMKQMMQKWVRELDQ